MKKHLFCLLCAVTLPVLGVSAQENPISPQPPVVRRPISSSSNENSEQLDGNYLLTLTSKGKEQGAKELAFVVATPRFNTSSSMQPVTSFNGTLTPQKDGDGFIVSYQLNSQAAVPTRIEPVAGGTSAPINVSYYNVNNGASVLLHLGETAQILKDGDQVYTLKLDRYKAEAPAKDAAAKAP